jgi:ATP-dependent DNA helicase RecG
MVKKLSSIKQVAFQGVVTVFNDAEQIVNPTYEEIDPEISIKAYINEHSQHEKPQIKVFYPTVNGVAPNHIGGIIDKVPSYLWEEISEDIPRELTEERELLSLTQVFNIIHGKIPQEEWSEDLLNTAFDRLRYQEFFENQIKLKSRRTMLKKRDGHRIDLHAEWPENHFDLFPYQLTNDQKKALEDIRSDILDEAPMMRLVQGDVGSGKTTIALIALLAAIEDAGQTAFMCPTEALAYQHYKTIRGLFPSEIRVELLVGSLKKSEKERIANGLRTGDIDLIVGTHTLIQESVEFKNLSMVIIDEQHKFGVGQRLKLVEKGEGVHCLILTATPIPRSLSLTQYGDLDLSIVKSLPANRKGIKTKIVTNENYQKYLSFLKTRVSMGEQAYIVVPAISENEELDIKNLESSLELYRNYLPEFRIEGLHGQLHPSLKTEVFEQFNRGEIDILVSTSVIEVGINVINATTMSILGPERFGLSSLHQLRGRVGRGEKPGFCFLVNDKAISQDSLNRLKVIENNIDGFIIAEEDLKTRGEGDIFGLNQSGSRLSRIPMNLLEHSHLLEWAKTDVDTIYNHHPTLFNDIIKPYKDDLLVVKTI